jgi:hypothetical protein
VLYVMGFLQLPRPETPAVGILPVPLVVLVAGLVLGIALALLARGWAKVGARHRKAVVAKRLRTSITAVSDERLIGPVSAVLERHRQTRVHLDEAAG